MLRFEGFRQEREEVAKCMEDLRGEFMTAIDERWLALVLDQAVEYCRTLGYAVATSSMDNSLITSEQ